MAVEIKDEVEVLKQQIIDETAKKIEEKLKGEKSDADINAIVETVKKQLLVDKSFVFGKKDEVEPGAFAQGIKKALAEGTGSAGGYLVPNTYINKIIDIMKIRSLVLKYADIMPVATNQGVVPTLDTGVSFTWTNENTAGTESNPVFGQLNLTVKKGMAITTIPNELLEDKTIGGAVDQYLIKLFGRAFAKEIDRVALTGDTGAGDPFDGIINTTGVTTVTAASTTDPAYKELVSVTTGINDDYSVNPMWIAHRTFYAKCFELLDANNRPILNPEAKTLVAYPYVRNERMPHDFSTGKPIALFGDLGVVRIAMRQNLVIEASKQVKFTADQTVLRAKFRMGIGVAPADSFVLYKLG
jgi:HK97 family phage major capsid protein